MEIVDSKTFGQKTKIWLKDQFTFTTYEITITGLIIALWIVSYKFISLDLVVMKIGVTHAIAILVGLIFKPLQGVMIGIIADTICIATSSRGFAFWMWEYAIIYPAIILTTSALKTLLAHESEKVWMIANLTTLLLTIAFLVFMAIKYKDLRRVNSSNQDNVIDMTQTAMQVIFWTFSSLLLLWTIVMFTIYYKKRIPRIKEHISIVVITLVIIIVFSWFWGTYAQTKYLEKFTSIKKKTLSEIIDIYFAPRVLKTPVTLVFYPLVTIPLYRVNQLVGKKNITTW